MRTIIILSATFFIVFNGIKINAQITNSEKESLIYMFEEEKLAHDVYSAFSEKYSLPIFGNITKSEAYHMSLVENLLTKNNIEFSKKEQGIFNNPELQKLYNQLTEQGNENLTKALSAGAAIEDIDIYDLEKYINSTENEDIKSIYTKLICGSKNHMRAFTRQLNFKKVTYTPNHISKDYYKTIINSEHKRCF